MRFDFIEMVSMRKSKVFSLFFLFFFLSIGCSGCSDLNQSENEENEDQVYIYYIDKNETKLVPEEYEPIGQTNDELINEYLLALSSDPKDTLLKKAKSKKIIVEKYVLSEDHLLSLYFSTEYSSLSGISEVLCRASIVKTLTQIEDIEVVEFYVGGQPLTEAKDKSLRMKDTDFILSTGVEDVYVTLYFSNEEGTALVESNLKITYDGNVSIEKLILNRLIQGPIEDNMKNTLPSGTELIKVSTQDNVCYVDLNEKFLEKVQGVSNDVVLYSIVNSLVELSTITKVQFTINGSTKKTYQDTIVFDGLFERNLELLETTK